MAGYLERYLAGEYEQVWQELWPRFWKEAQGEPFRSEALAVARAMMKRVRCNLETLVARAQAVGYRFGYDWILPEDAGAVAWSHLEPPVLSDPLPDLAQRLQRLANHGLLLPLSVQAWYEEVGAVNLVGTPPMGWGQGIMYEHDPLQIDALDDDIIKQCAADRQLILGPDAYSKYYTSGGGPYYVDLGAPSTDARIQGCWRTGSFVEYLRVALSWGGFPGLGRLAKRPQRDIEQLTTGLLPF
jgi:hypothetical protein